MKRAIKLLGVLLLVALTFGGCSSADERNTEKLAEQFAANLYTVDEKQVTEFNEAGKGDTIKTDEIVKDLYKSIQPLMTKDGYESFFKNRGYITNVKGCVKNDCTMQVINLILTKRSENSEKNEAGYDYKVKVKFTFNKDKKEQVDEATGYIGLYKENGEWRISAYREFSIPKLFMKI